MKRFVFSLAFSAITAGLWAQDAPAVVAENPNAAEITFEKETHDFGDIKKGDNGTVEFKFKNTGKEPLIISNARGSCGCTVPQWPKEPIKPGDVASIKVTYDTNRIGPFTKTVTITSNAKIANKTITIKGKVDDVPAEEVFPGVQKSGMPFDAK